MAKATGAKAGGPAKKAGAATKAGGVAAAAAKVTKAVGGGATAKKAGGKTGGAKAGAKKAVAGAKASVSRTTRAAGGAKGGGKKAAGARKGAARTKPKGLLQPLIEEAKALAIDAGKGALAGAVQGVADHVGEAADKLAPAGGAPAGGKRNPSS